MSIPSNRIIFIDLLRGWAGLVMIEVHVVNAFLIPAFRDSSWFAALNFVNGLVAPAFLFVAGLVFAIVSERKLEQYKNFGTAFWKQIGRIFLVWGIGYGLHIPSFSLTKTLHETTDAGWLRFYQVDVLHCIAAGLLLLFLLRLGIRRRSLYRNVLVTFGIVTVLATPFMWETDFHRMLHPAVAAYMNSQHISLFPLFPWLGFILLGGAVGMFYLKVVQDGNEVKFVRRISAWGIGLIATYAFLGSFLGAIDIRANPFFFGLRFGIVLLLLAFFWWYERKRGTEKSFVLDVSHETLLVYAAHLLVIYGTFWSDRSLASIIGKTLTPEWCLAGSIALSAVMVAAAKGWGRWKRWSRTSARYAALSAGLLVILIFFIK